MSGQRKKDSKQLSIWITKEERAQIEKEMDELGFENLSDFIRHKLEMDESPKGRPPEGSE